jgi:hypothetical protein
VPEPSVPEPGGRCGIALTAGAVLLVWAVLVAPDRLAQLTPGVLLRIPLEGLVLVALALLLPPRARAVGTTAAGALIGVLTVVRLLDLGFREALYRPFDPVTDWRLLGPGLATFRDSLGTGAAVAAVVGAVLLALALPVVMALAVRRSCRVAARHRRAASGVLGTLGAAWLVAAVAGAQLVPGEPVASASAARLAVDQARAARENLRDLPVFRAQLAAADPYRALPAADLLTGLRGKDVVIAFVESYGRVAVQGSPFSAGVRQALDAGTEQLQAAGFSARSAFLTSPTFGGVSWLAHATFHSGLWVDRQQRHDQLLAGDRFTLAAAFHRAGWRTVLDVPSNRTHWREGRAFYRFDRDYYRDDVGYAGPRFSYASMPDQYTLAALQQREFAPGHAPVMAEIDLVSSHTPWTPQPRLVGWGRIGDGSVFDPMPAEGPTPAEVAGDRARIGTLYGRSIRYSLQALVSWVTTFHARDDDLVLVLLGDHQPAAVVSGPHASHDVPVTVVARDPAVLQRIAPWGWDAGLRPTPDAPVWRMDAFRDRFLTAFGDREGP